MYTLNCKGNLVLVDKPLVMGILNLTNDSFYKGSRLHDPDAVLAAAVQMAEEGADILDVGAQSTRAGSERMTAEKEVRKMESLIPKLKAETGKLISIDTYHADVATAAVELGADMVNDISGGTMDERMITTVGKLKVPYICMHIRGTPETMQQNTDYEDILKEIIDFFIRKIDECTRAGINDVIIDPGFGFAKNIRQNFLLLKNLRVFSMLEKPILAGLSRKSFIYKTLGIEPDEALNGTTAMNMVALQNGASILRVHDVKEAVEVVKLCERLTE